MTQIAETFATISKQSHLDSCDDCEATDRARALLYRTPIGQIVYVSQEDGPNGTIMQLFANPHDAASTFVGIPLLWDPETATDAITIEFHRQARAFLQAPKIYQASFTYDEGWGSCTNCQLYAAEIVE